MVAVAILVQKGFKLNGDIWDGLPWEGDMPDEIIGAFALIYSRIENERIQKYSGF